MSLAAGFAGWRYRQERAVFLQQHLDIDWLNKLGWQDFERQVAEVYRQQGYWVDEVGGGGADGGVDLRLKRDGQTLIVQCKRWKTYKVGVKPVRKLFGVMAAEKADRAVFISIFHSPASPFFSQSSGWRNLCGCSIGTQNSHSRSCLRKLLSRASSRRRVLQV